VQRYVRCCGSGSGCIGGTRLTLTRPRPLVVGFAGCFTITTVFSHAQTVVSCSTCSQILCQPSGGKARLTEGTLRSHYLSKRACANSPLRLLVPSQSMNVHRHNQVLPVCCSLPLHLVLHYTPLHLPAAPHAPLAAKRRPLVSQCIHSTMAFTPEKRLRACHCFRHSIIFLKSYACVCRHYGVNDMPSEADALFA